MIPVIQNKAVDGDGQANIDLVYPITGTYVSYYGSQNAFVVGNHLREQIPMDAWVGHPFHASEVSSLCGGILSCLLACLLQ